MIQTLIEALDISKYECMEMCRATMLLRQREDGYNNGRGISLNKQYQMRDVIEIDKTRMRISNSANKLFHTYQAQYKDLKNQQKSLDPDVNNILLFQQDAFKELLPDYNDSTSLTLHKVMEFDIHDNNTNIQTEVVEVKKDREQVNYIKLFYEKFKDVLKIEYWNLLLFDLIQDICNRELSTQSLELKLFTLLKSVSAAQYLCLYRKEIVEYLFRNQFWNPHRKTQEMKQGSTMSLSQIGIDVETESKLGLNVQMPLPKQKKQQSFQEGLAEFNPEEFVKMDQKKLLQYFPTSTKTERNEYTYIRIDPLPRKKIPTDDLIPIVQLPDWAQKAFEGTTHLNTIQSKIYERAFKSEENILVCAPTGAGKTNIAMLCILQEISKRIDPQTQKLINHDFKIVYISPMKALASEIVEKFQQKLRYLGVRVKEFTGDMQLTKKELQETHIILTTPEKWDVITRKTNQISEILQLLIIDEVHLLNDERGPILECVVARTVQQVQRAQRHIRMLGLSATLPNYWDVAIFLHVHKESTFYFDQTYRPVPLCQKFIGIKEPIQQAVQKGQKRRTKKDIYNEQAYEILSEVVKHNKQVLVFVHSRKETMKYGQYVLERAQRFNDKHIYGGGRSERVKINDGELKKLVPYNIAFHHAGMLRADRNAVERMFLNGEVRVLMATATLAWGVNLPAYAVIIKGTDVFDVAHSDMQNLSVLDVQQMFGRAGRPQFDNRGEATLMTDNTNVGYYMSMLNNASYIESKLLVFLKEALNAEIVLGNITNYKEAFDWLDNTFLSIRLRRNDRHYGVVNEFDNLDLNCETLVHRKIEEALLDLDVLQMVRYDKSRSLVVSTELGRIASHYYIKCETMKILCDGMSINFDQAQNNFKDMSTYDILKVLAQAKEFEMIRVKPEETKELVMVYEKYWVFNEQPFGVDFEDEEIVIDAQTKVIGLISGYIAKVQYENHALIIDTHVIIQNCIRLMRCMLEMAIKKNMALITLKLQNLCKLVENRMDERQSPLFQFSKEIFQGYNSRRTNNHRDGFIPNTFLDCIYDLDKSAEWLIQQDDHTLSRILRCQIPAVHSFRRYLEYLPQVIVDYHIKPIASTIIQITVFVTPDWQFSNRWHLRNEPFWIFVDDGQELLHSEEFLLSQEFIERRSTMEVKFFIPYATGTTKYYLNVLSDRWIMREEGHVEINVGDLMIQEDQVAFTELLDLQPLPTSVLANPKWEALYSFKYFNPIQSQVFFALFNTDDNVLIGAPTGSGKTNMAELAMFRVFKHQPERKVVYIAPMKAIAKERLKDWNTRLSKIGKTVLELTGDVTPDLKALMQANVLITTPEKWDGISRNWSTRAYVRNTGLIIFDEIHLLGQDRGPVLEVIVSRMNLISKELKCRMVGLSTAMANGLDVSNWFGVKNNRFYNFKPSCRPVPVTIHFNGFPERAYCPRMATMNKPAYNDIKRYSEGKPTIIFVSSRRQTRLTAFDLISLAMQEGNEKQYILCNQDYLKHLKIEDEQLKQTIEYGIGMHHSGLSRHDRTIVEDLFVNAKIQLLIATSTVAWGVNFPARFVIIKGTEFYDPKLKKYVDFPVTDILQMIGRAGRPQFDTQATACVYVEQSRKNFYRKYLNSPFPIESSLLGQLSDHINAEIAAGTIKNDQSFIDWITWTYFFRRLVKNPTYYGIANSNKDTIKEYLNQLIQNTIKELQRSKCVEADLGVYQTTFWGKLCAFYYVHHQTLRSYLDKINQKSVWTDHLKTLAYSQEFNEVPVRHNEDNYNTALAKICPLQANMKLMDSPNEKTFLLLQAHIYRLKVPIKDYETDQKLVLDSCMRMLHCMIDIAAEKRYLKTTIDLIMLMQRIVQGFIETNYKVTKNLPYPIESNINSLQALIKQQKEVIDQTPEGHKKENLEAIKNIPTLFVQHNFKDEDLIVTLKFTSGPVLIQSLQKHRECGWWVIVSDQDTVLGIKKYHQSGSRTFAKLPKCQKIHILSDSYLGLDMEVDL